MSEEAPPLRVWLYPILAVFTISAFVSLLLPIPAMDLMARWWRLSNKNLEKALIENTRDTSALSIVILGSSLTEYAFADPQ